MRITRAFVAAIALAATIGSVSASAQASSDQSATLDGVTVVPTASKESVSASDKFATLGGVTAVPMTSEELDTVKGLHVHFSVNGDPHATGEPPDAAGPHFPAGDAAPSYNGIRDHACGNGTITIVGGPDACS